MIPRHPTWSARAPLWRVWLESWRGGEYFRAASIGASASVSATAGSQAVIARWSWSSFTSESGELLPAAWLWSHARESDDQYAERVARSAYRRYAGFSCDVLSAGVTEPVGLPTTRLGPDWLANVTGTGVDLRTFRRQLATLTTVFGHAWVGADRPVGGVDAGEVYLYAISPLDLVDWQVGPGRQLSWALVRERRAATRPFPFTQSVDPATLARGMGPFGAVTDRYRLWTPEYSQLYDADEKPVGPAMANALGRVPLECVYYQVDTGSPDPLGVGVMQDLAPVNLHEYNMRSLRDVILTDTCFPFLALARAAGETRIDPETQVEIGTDRALAYDAAGSPPIWVQPSPESVETLTNMIREDVQAIRELAGLKISNEDSAAAVSAEALRLTRANLDARFSAHAANLCDGELRYLRLAQEIAGLGPDGVESTWPSDYGAQQTGGRLEDVAKALDAGLRDSPLAHAELLKSAAQTVLTGAPPRVMRAIGKEIDATAQEAKQREADMRKAQVEALKGMAKGKKPDDAEDAEAEDAPGDGPGSPGPEGRDAFPPRGGSDKRAA